MSAKPIAPRSALHGWTFRMTRIRIALLAVFGLGAGVIVYRLIYGLGAATNLSDGWPWGLWVWWDVLTGVALAGGGYSTALMVHFLGRGRWREVERAAFLTSLIGYLMVCAGLVLDLGRWFNAPTAFFFWRGNPHSVMLELIWCVSGYTVVQLVEFGHIFLERVRIPRLSRVLARIYVPVLIVGIILPFLHQSALGSLYVIANGRLDPLWWSMLLPLFFLMSSFFVGPAMVTVETSLSSRAHGRRPPIAILTEMVRFAGWVMVAYLALRFGDLIARDGIDGAFDGSPASTLFWMEVVLGVAVPAAVFLHPRLRASFPWVVAASSLTVAGVALNRANVVFTAMAGASRGASYVPYWMEVAVTVGLISAGVLLYLFVTENFAIVPDRTPDHERSRGDVLVLGVGNVLMSDEGVGVRAAELLRRRAPDGVKVLEAGTLGPELLPDVEAASRLLVLDCVDAGKAPGTAVRLDGSRLLEHPAPTLSAHEFALVDLLSLAALHATAPAEVVVLGVQPATIEPGLDLSPEVERAVTRLAASGLAELERWLGAAGSHAP
jgi:hydrogenase maturation protease